MIYLKNPCALAWKNQNIKKCSLWAVCARKHFEKNEVILSAGCTTHEIGAGAVRKR